MTVKRGIALLLSCVFVPLFPSVVLALIEPAPWPGVGLVAKLAMVPIFYFFSFIATFSFALPVFSFLLLIGWARWWSSIALGAATGCIASVVVIGFSLKDLSSLILLGALGAVSASVFWHFWKKFEN